MESFNKEIKKLLTNKYLANKNKFSIYLALPEVIKIYNNNNHGSTKYSPNYLFSCKDKGILKEIIQNIKNSQKNKKSNVVGMKKILNFEISF